MNPDAYPVKKINNANMKSPVTAFLAMAFLVSACNSKTDKTNTAKDTMSSEIKPDTTKQDLQASTDFSIKGLVHNYLRLKNALAKDDAKQAAEAGSAVVADLNGLDPNRLPPDQKMLFQEVAEDAKEHAEHIRDNAGDLTHQREHFAILSKDVNDLLNVFPAGQKLYQDFCPMYNDGKGAIWISEFKEIKNPYYGNEMLTCGTVKKEW
jgi:uncharacterized protein (DUF885 family)